MKNKKQITKGIEVPYRLSDKVVAFAAPNSDIEELREKYLNRQPLNNFKQNVIQKRRK